MPISEKDVPSYLSKDALDQRFRGFIARDEVTKALDTLTGEYADLKRRVDEHQKLVENFSNQIAEHGASLTKLSAQHIQDMQQLVAQNSNTLAEATQRAIDTVHSLVQSVKPPAA